MTEEVREALMRLVMCAREECDMCKHKDECDFEFQYNISTENMGTILGALSAEAEWIPCSERLPSEDGRYLVCMNWEHCNISVLNWADGWNCYRGINGESQRNSEIDGEDIIAWMQLPKPYREDGEV